MHSTVTGPSHSEWGRRLPSTRSQQRLRFLRTEGLLSADLPTAYQLFGQRKQRTCIKRQDAAELVDKQLVRDIHARRGEVTDSGAARGRDPGLGPS